MFNDLNKNVHLNIFNRQLKCPSYEVNIKKIYEMFYFYLPAFFSKDVNSRY